MARSARSSSPPRRAADALKVSRWQLYRLLRMGKLRSVKIGKLRRIPLTALEAYVEGLADAPLTAERGRVV